MCARACERGYKITGLWDYVAKQWYNCLRGGLFKFAIRHPWNSVVVAPSTTGEGVTDERSRHSIYPPNILHALWPISTISSRPTLLVNVVPTIHYCPSILFHRCFSSALRRETSLADSPLRERRSNAVTTHSHPYSSTVRTRPSWPDIDTYHVRGSVDEHTERHSPSARPEKSRSCRTNSTRHSGSHSPRRSGRGCSGESVGGGEGGCAASFSLPKPILLACLRVATTQAPPRGWVVTVRSTVGVDRIPNWVGDVGTWGLLGRGRLSLEVRGKRRTLTRRWRPSFDNIGCWRGYTPRSYSSSSSCGREWRGTRRRSRSSLVARLSSFD